MIDAETLAESLRGRDVFIWGTRLLGIGVLYWCQRNGIPVSGFVDSYPVNRGKLHGKNIYKPEHIYQKEKCSVILCSREHSFYLNDVCKEHAVQNIINWNDMITYDYYFSTTNKCNLRCCTCNCSSLYNKKNTVMTAEYFEKCLQKIINEDPFSVTVFLYGINEPLLDRDLPAKIGLCKKYGLSCGFSTNCTVAYDYRSLMESQPDWIRVSISGVKENYENMHRGARWKTLSANLRELSKQRDTASPETKIELFFHRYRHNACDIPIAQELADELNLEFHTIEASIIGMESVYSYLEGLPIPFAMRDALPLLLHSPEETAARALQLRHVPCEQKNMLRIEADGRMSACQCWEASIIGDATFLQTPLQEIRKLHDANPLCRHCMKKGLQHYYGVVFNEDDRTDN